VPLPSEPGEPAVPAFAVNDYFHLPERPPKFQHGWAAWPIGLFLLTAASTSFAGFMQTYSLSGLWYAVAILLILGAHEFGHYFACRWHNVDCTLPYFIPAPGLMTGTLGAVIKIREPFPSRTALFDIGVAGPIAGFVTLLPFMIGGIMLSDVVALPEESGTLILGEPLLFKYLAGLIHGPLPEGSDIMIHPMGFAAWFGMLATALNLMPFGQLDGGHIAYAVFGRRTAGLSLVTLAAVIGLAIVSLSWIAMAIMLTAMTWFVGLRHPAPYDDVTPLSRGRLIVAGLALLIFISCFTPVPITIAWE
jgi:membrane-associated protease RseP (regulator of RpoE activity)